MCLADVIETVVMTEEHASAVLTQVSLPCDLSESVLNYDQVVQALYEIACNGIKYNNLKASRVFISEEGVVQLGNDFPTII